jgi:hypothetical protein
MDGAATISLRELVLEFGNRFFNIEDSEWMNYQDDLHYETTETDGINGYVLKMEEKADGYGNSLFVFLINIYWGLKSLLFKEHSNLQFDSSKTNNSKKSVQSRINNKVQDRLLSVINEDIEKWNKYQERSLGHQQARAYASRNTKTDKGMTNKKSNAMARYSFSKLFSPKQKRPQNFVKNPIRETVKK